jgi:hypothetical protein
MPACRADAIGTALGSAAALALGILTAWPALGQQPESAPVPQNLTPVGCRVSIGIASDQKGETNERFRGLPSNFGSVQLWKEEALKLQFGEQGRMPLPNGTEMSVEPINVRGRTLRMKVNVPGVVDARLRLQNHSPLVVGPMPHEDGYLVIRVEPEFTDHLVPEREGGAGPESIPVNDKH